MNKPRLFCFTFAGGTKAFFDVIKPDLDGADIITLEYAGHGERQKENYYQNFNELADDLFDQIKDKLGSCYSLFGYSMGTIASIEVLRRIVNSGLSKPQHIFLAAHEPHTKSELLGFTDNEADEWVRERTIKFGAVPGKLHNNKVFWRTYLPMYRADYAIIGKYEFDKLDIKMNIPTTVFYSEIDTPLSEIKQWDRFFPCEYIQFDGNHFFIQEHHEEIGKIIKNRMGIGL